MPAYAARRDKPESEIVQAARQIGASISRLDANYQSGVPDLLIGFRAVNVLVEVKGPAGKLLDSQVAFREQWRGQYDVAHNVDELIAILDRYTLRPATPLDGLLSRDQQQALATALRQATDRGFGEVTVEVKNGRPRFVRLSVSDALPGAPNRDQEASSP